MRSNWGKVDSKLSSDWCLYKKGKFGYRDTETHRLNRQAKTGSHENYAVPS